MIKKLFNDKKGVGINSYVITLLVISAFIFFSMSFASVFIYTRNSNAEVLTYGNNSIMRTISSINSSFGSISNYTKQIQDEVVNGQPSAVDYMFLIFRGAFEVSRIILKTILLPISLISNVLFGSIAEGLGTSSEILFGLSLLITGLTITGVLMTIRFIRSGNE